MRLEKEWKKKGHIAESFVGPEKVLTFFERNGKQFLVYEKNDVIRFWFLEDGYLWWLYREMTEEKRIRIAEIILM